MGKFLFSVVIYTQKDDAMRNWECIADSKEHSICKLTMVETLTANARRGLMTGIKPEILVFIIYSLYLMFYMHCDLLPLT